MGEKRKLKQSKTSDISSFNPSIYPHLRLGGNRSPNPFRSRSAVALLGQSWFMSAPSPVPEDHHFSGSSFFQNFVPFRFSQLHLILEPFMPNIPSYLAFGHPSHVQWSSLRAPTTATALVLNSQVIRITSL